MCKILKVRNELSKDLGLAITYAQLINMGREKIVDMLLNLKGYFLAIHVCKMFKMDTDVLSKIFIEWALTLIFNDRTNQQEEIADKIFTRFCNLQEDRGKPEFLT